ncbi:signal peptidase I, partial [bacterium LRH843]|nr:signal peptidase I [bacterium LRH843]
VVRDPGQRINIIKRVIGHPGDTVEVRAGRLYLNGDLIERVEREEVRYRSRDGGLVSAIAYDEIMPDGSSHVIYERSD